ncbi:hypothetical protein WJX77_011961 [Trebouxia sp. C0004]
MHQGGLETFGSPWDRRQQQQDISWLAGLRQHHQEHQRGHDRAICTVTGSQHTTGQMRQLAQAEVDWTSFRSAIELYHAPNLDHQGHLAHPTDDTSPAIAEDFSRYSLPDCSSRTVTASECSPRSGYIQNSPRSPCVQPRPFTAPTIVSCQPPHLHTDSPCYVSSLYKGQQQANLHLQYRIHANADHSMHSMIQDGSSWSVPQPCSPVEPYLRSRSGGMALTYASRERDRPQTSSDATTAQPQASGGSPSRTKKLGTQADWCIAAANDAMTPQIYTTGPV